jgi:hypothetical protein
VEDSQRQVSELAPLVFDGLGFIDLIPGAYLITYNEIVHLPGLHKCQFCSTAAGWSEAYTCQTKVNDCYYSLLNAPK